MLVWRGATKERGHLLYSSRYILYTILADEAGWKTAASGPSEYSRWPVSHSLCTIINGEAD